MIINPSYPGYSGIPSYPARIFIFSYPIYSYLHTPDIHLLVPQIFIPSDPG